LYPKWVAAEIVGLFRKLWSMAFRNAWAAPRLEDTTVSLLLVNFQSHVEESLSPSHFQA